jgi:hypothetical protein
MADSNITVKAAELVTSEVFSYYNTNLKKWTKKKIADGLTSLGTILNLKGTAESIEELATKAVDPKNGDVWLIGTADDAEFEERYYYNGTWEYIGLTSPSLEGLITKASLYAGADGTGTTDSPAEGTVLYNINAAIKTNTDAIAAINDETTGILATAKKYTDDSVGALTAEDGAITALAARVTDAEAFINGITYLQKSDIDAMFNDSDDD